MRVKQIEWIKGYHFIADIVAYSAELTPSHNAFIVRSKDGKFHWRLQKESIDGVFAKGVANTVEEAKLACQEAWEKHLARVEK